VTFQGLFGVWVCLHLAGAERVVLGMADGFDLSLMLPFVGSLRESGFHGKVVLFTSSPPVGIGMFALRYNITIARFTPPAHKYHPALHRYSLLASISPESEDQWLVVDVRDVVFQDDPFEALEAALPNKLRSLHLIEELPPRQIGGCDFNREWLLQCFGQAAQSVLKHNVLNSGVIMGPAEAVQLLARRMVDSFTTTGCRVGLDQPHLNWLYYGPPRNGTDTWGHHDVHIWTGINSLAAVVGSIASDELDEWARTPSHHHDQRPTRLPAAIVHQYDRSERLFAVVQQRWFED